VVPTPAKKMHALEAMAVSNVYVERMDTELSFLDGKFSNRGHALQTFDRILLGSKRAGAYYLRQFQVWLAVAYFIFRRGKFSREQPLVNRGATERQLTVCGPKNAKFMPVTLASAATNYPER
jgi:hypothetical protein